MNIVIPFRNTCGTQELEMCVKLIIKNMGDLFENIHILGDEVDFVHPRVHNHRVKEQKYNKWLDSGFLVDYFIRYVNLENRAFYLFNDDFFITEPINKSHLDCYYHFSTLKERILTTYVIEPKTNILRLSAYGMNIQRFIDLFGDYENYEVHLPLKITRPELMSRAIEETTKADCPALKRTYYMKLLKEEYGINPAEKLALPHDIKFGEPLRVMQYPFFSLTDIEFKAFEKEFNKILSK